MRISTLIVGFAAVCGVAIASHAQPYNAAHTGLYFNVDAGAAFTQDTDFENFPGGVTPGTKIEFNTGFRAGFSGGYMFNPYLGVEGHLGIMESRLEEVSGAEMEAYMAQMPFMANVVLQLPNQSIVTPYAGAGVGGSTVFLDVDYWYQNNTYLEGADADTVFAWQAFAGVRFALNENMDLGVEYRYVASEGPEWDSEGIYTPDSSIRFGDLQTHTVALMFRMRF
jgi:opacity protein-like surface antigen